MPSGSAYGGAANAANGARLGKQLEFEADAAAAAKMLTTPRLNIPGGEEAFALHFYKKVSGELYYYDYKVKLGGGQRT